MDKVRYIYTCICGRRLTKKKALAMEKAKERRVVEGCRTEHFLVKNKILTKGQIERFIREKVLVPTIHRGRAYFTQDDVVKALRRLLPPPTLFSL